MGVLGQPTVGCNVVDAGWGAPRSKSFLDTADNDAMSDSADK